jgi:fucose 4-O-acetylase-like acetyltransferase
MPDTKTLVVCDSPPTALSGPPGEGSVRPHVARDPAIDFMRAVAIVLVVFGHAQRGLFASGDHGGPGWYEAYRLLDYFIYTFHVPVFFLTSGFLIESRAPVSWSQAIARLGRLMLLYLIWNTLNAVPAIIFADVINRDLRDVSAWYLLNPLRPTGIMWFFVAFMAAQLLHVATQPLKWTRYGLMAIAVVVIALGRDVSGIAYGTLWFLFGAALTRVNYKMTNSTWHVPAALCGFVLITLVSFQLDVPTTLAIPSCILAVFALHELGRAFPPWAAVASLSQATLAIYVTHVILVAGARIAALKILGLTSIPLVLAITTVAGIIGPLVLLGAARRLRLSKVLVLD